MLNSILVIKKAIQILCDINQTSTVAIWDTGASVSLMDKDYFEKCMPHSTWAKKGQIVENSNVVVKSSLKML